MAKQHPTRLQKAIAFEVRKISDCMRYALLTYSQRANWATPQPEEPVNVNKAPAQKASAKPGMYPFCVLSRIGAPPVHTTTGVLRAPPIAAQTAVPPSPIALPVSTSISEAAREQHQPNTTVAPSTALPTRRPTPAVRAFLASATVVQSTDGSSTSAFTTRGNNNSSESIGSGSLSGDGIRQDGGDVQGGGCTGGDKRDGDVTDGKGTAGRAGGSGNKPRPRRVGADEDESPGGGGGSSVATVIDPNADWPAITHIVYPLPGRKTALRAQSQLIKILLLQSIQNILTHLAFTHAFPEGDERTAACALAVFNAARERPIYSAVVDRLQKDHVYSTKLAQIVSVSTTFLAYHAYTLIS